MDNVVFTACNTHDHTAVLLSDDYQYLKDRIMHYRNYHCNREEMPIETARAYESAKTIVTAFEHLSKVYPLICITVDIDIRSATATANGIFRSGNSVDISYDNTDRPESYGKFIVTHNASGYANDRVTICEYSVNDSAIVAYDMVFPAPSNFRSIIGNALFGNK